MLCRELFSVLARNLHFKNDNCSSNKCSVYLKKENTKRMRKKLGDKKNPFLNTQPNRYCGTKEQSLGDVRRTY